MSAPKGLCEKSPLNPTLQDPGVTNRLGTLLVNVSTVTIALDWAL